MTDGQHYSRVRPWRPLAMVVGVQLGVTAVWIALELAYRWRRIRAWVS
jgi:hypothetical protein